MQGWLFKVIDDAAAISRVFFSLAKSRQKIPRVYGSKQVRIGLNETSGTKTKTQVPQHEKDPLKAQNCIILN